MKIAFFELENWETTHIKEKFQGHELLFFDKPLSQDNVGLVKDVDAIAVFIYSQVSRAIMMQMPNLKLVTTMSTGFDHIDIAYCKEKNIIACYVPTYGENTVAEHTFALILAVSRKIFPSIERTHHEHVFETDISLRGFDLRGRTLGIIGCGNIGKHVARIGVGFEMNVVVFDMFPDYELALKVGYKYVDMDTLLRLSDIITLHMPSLPSTTHMINEETINKMKSGVYIINTARGPLIDTNALIVALDNGKVAGAALDVIEEEKEIKDEKELLKKELKDVSGSRLLLEDHLLMKMNNVLITPHNAFNSQEALERILNTTIFNLVGFVENKPVNIVKESVSN